jgi:hypothetical protein
VTSPLSRLAAAFVAPREGARPQPMEHGPLRRASGRSAARRSAPGRAIAVLARPADAAAAGGAVALAAGGGAVLVLLWGAEPPGVRAPATPAARRTAARLADRGHETVATGRLVLVALRQGIDEAVRAASATTAAAILVVAAPRDERVDAVLRGHDRAIAVGEGAIAELAAQGVAAFGVPARTLELPAAAPARALAVSGVALVAPLRAPVEEALR